MWMISDSIHHMSSKRVIHLTVIAVFLFACKESAIQNDNDEQEEEDSYELPAGFPEDFPVQFDHLTGDTLGGWGGGAGKITRTPIIFIHGNGANADSWLTVGQTFLDSGYVPAELWALSYLDFQAGYSSNSNIANIPEIESFVNDVLDYTGEDKVVVISHSFGVTVARAWMKEYNQYMSVSHFIGIAGPNHGVCYCDNDTTTPICQEIGSPDSEFLTWLNEPDETPFEETIKYMTIFDGTGWDVFYLDGCTMNDGSVLDLRQSPILEGAHNFQLEGANHNALKDSPDAIEEMLHFLEQ